MRTPPQPPGAVTLDISTGRARGPRLTAAFGNILWFVLAGWWLALYYALCGLIAFVLIVTIPFGIAAFRLAGYALWPFDRRVIAARDAGVPSVPQPPGAVTSAVFTGRA